MMMDPMISDNLDTFSQMILNSEQQNNLESDFDDFYLNDGSWEENHNSYNYDEDEDDESGFGSSQLHQLVHTQPIHLINCQMLSDYTLGGEKNYEGRASSKASVLSSLEDVEVVSENGMDSLYSDNMTNDVNTAATSATSEHFKHDIFDLGPEEWNLWKQQQQQQISASNFYESNFGETSGAGLAKNNIQEIAWDVPRILPFDYKDVGSYLDFSQCINPQEELEISPLHLQQQQPVVQHQKRNNRQVTTEPPTLKRRPTEEENFFVKTLNAKLSRYTGYFGAGSRDQEYHDKVRFQEISYKFSKTYL